MKKFFNKKNNFFEMNKESDRRLKVSCLVLLDEKGFENTEEKALSQLINVASMDGVKKAVFAMPDIHCGYGFPIGAVAAFDRDSGVISPGAIGYDINCGVRLIKTKLFRKDIEEKTDGLARALFSNIPSGVGGEGKIKLSSGELKKVLRNGASWAVERGLGKKENLPRIESLGFLCDVDDSFISKKAFERGAGQLGTLGSGNHFIEIGYADKIYDKKSCEIFGLEEGMITVMIHSGSRGLGHQICVDNLENMKNAVKKYRIEIADAQLACAPFKSEEGQKYFNSMKCAANYAWANREILSHLCEEAILKFLGLSKQALGFFTVYDLAHNIAKEEEHLIDGKYEKLIVHRKGATRCLSAGHPLLEDIYSDIGQPVILPGDMGRYSFLLTALKGAETAFFSCAHGAGRVMSRSAALKKFDSSFVKKQLRDFGVSVKADNYQTLSEEMPYAYKDAQMVADIIENANIAKKSARLRPLAVIKG